MASVPIKFSANTYRVKSLSFHPTRSWLLVGLANGSIQVWDYRLENLLHTYTDCGTSPIRCVLWHPTQPLFAASGDDQLIRIFNYQKKICLFALQGHNDYVRSLQFHHEQPWLLSASDDQTIRIWNWQSRACICEILGHHYYVMDAKFHPHLPLIATASLDNTVRIWNYAQLLNRQSGSSGLLPPSLQAQQHGSSSALDGILPDVEIVAVLDQNAYVNSIQWYYHQPTQQTYLFFAGKDHDIRVFTLSSTNYSTYHQETLRTNGHTGSITSLAINSQNDSGELLSTSEDGSAKIWTPVLSNGYLQYNGTGSVQTPIKRDDGQCWAGAIDATNGRLYAVGYETGFCLFKLSRERYGYGLVQTGQHTFNGKAYWMNNKQLLSCDIFSGSPSNLTSPTASANNRSGTTTLLNLSPTNDESTPGKDPLTVFSTKTGQNLANAPSYVRSFYINQHVSGGNLSQMLFTKGGTYNILHIQHNVNKAGTQSTTSNPDAIQEVFTGTAKYAVFVTQQRLMLLTKESDLVLLSSKNEKKRTLSHIQLVTLIKNYIQSLNQQDDEDNDTPVPPPTPTTVPTKFDDATIKQFTPIAMFPALSGHVLVRVPEYLLLIDANNFSIVSDFILPSRLTVKRILWSSDFQSLVICTKTLIYYASCVNIDGKRTLSLLSTHAESSRIKSICFDRSIVPTLSTSKGNTVTGSGVGSDEVILFNTATHLKYLLKNGHVGVLKTFHDVCYISALTDIPPNVLNAHLEETNGDKTSKDGKGKKKMNKNEITIGWSKYDKYLHYFTRQGKYGVLRVNCIEYLFKFALENRITPIVAEIMFSGLLNGNNVIFYVCDMGYYDLALHLSTDLYQKFILSLQCGNLKDAIDCAMTLNEPSIWEQLSVFALNCGNIVAVEQAYINTKNIQHLAFLYLLTGQLDKLQKVASICLATPPGVSNDRQVQEQSMKYELGLWISFALGQHMNTIGSLYTQLTHASNNTQDASTQLDSTNGIYNKGTVLALLRCVLQTPSSLTSPDLNNNALSQEQQQLIGGITTHLHEMNAHHKTTTAYETATMLHQSHPANLTQDGSSTYPSTWYEDVINRPVDCVANYPIQTTFVDAIITQSQQNATIASGGYIPGDIEDQFIDSLLDCTEMTFDKQMPPNKSLHGRTGTSFVTLPHPFHLSSLSSSLNGTSNEQTLLSPWAYLSHTNPELAQVGSQAAQPWPLLSPQQVQQYRQKQSTTKNQYGGMSTNNNNSNNNVGGNLNLNQPQDDTNWFADILSHAEGLAAQNTTGYIDTTGSNTLTSSNEQGQQPQQETWDLDLDIDDTETKTTGGETDFMDFNNDQYQNQAQVAPENLLLLQCAQFLALPKNDTIINHTYWANSIPSVGTENGNPFEAGPQTASTSRLFATRDFNTAFYTMGQQISPFISLSVPATPSNAPTSTTTLIKTAALNAHFSSFLYPSPYLSLNQIDNVAVETPQPPECTIYPPLTLPLQHTYIASNQQQTIQHKTTNLQSVPQIIVPFNPITIDTIKDRYSLGVQYLFKSQNDQAIFTFRSILQLLPLTSLLSTQSTPLDHRFILLVPFMARELITFGLIEQLKANLPSTSSTPTSTAPLSKITSTNPATIKAIYGVISTFTSYTEQLTSFNTDPVLQSTNQALFDIMLNAIWLSCKYLYPLNNFQLISHLCRKLLQLAQQYQTTYQSTLVNLDVARKMIKKCEQEGFKDNTPLHFQYTSTDPNQIQFDFNVIQQFSQQTQHIGSITFSKNININGQDTMVQLPKGINLTICSQTFTPITSSQILQQNCTVCSFCYAVAMKHFNNQKCNICQLGTYGGLNALGLQYE